MLETVQVMRTNASPDHYLLIGIILVILFDICVTFKASSPLFTQRGLLHARSIRGLCVAYNTCVPEQVRYLFI